MKKIIVLVVSCLMLLVCAVRADAVFAAELSDSIVLHLTENHTDDQIVINVNLLTNSGVSGMTLELDYDQNVFEFVKYERGQALSDCDLESTNRSNGPTLPIRFNWLNQNRNIENDFSGGNLLTLYFTLKPDCESGEYGIGFNYSNVGYIANGNALVKNAIIDKAVVSVTNSKIVEIAIQEPETPEKGADVLLIISICIFAVTAAAVAIVLIVRAKKNKERRKNWVKT